MKKKLSIIQMVCINVAIFWVGQALACYFHWVGTGNVQHGLDLGFLCTVSGVVTTMLNVFLWVIRSDMP